MKLSPKLRWALYGVALALTLSATLWVDRDSETTVAVPSAQARSNTIRGAAHNEPAVHASLDLGALPARAYGGANGDPFSPRSWKQMAADEARRDAPRLPPPVPQPPPLRFTYMGKLIEDGKTAIFLTRDDQNFIVHAGDTLARDYRVEEIGEAGMVLTYLPLKRRQQLAFDSDYDTRAAVSTPVARTNAGAATGARDEDDPQPPVAGVTETADTEKNEDN